MNTLNDMNGRMVKSGETVYNKNIKMVGTIKYNEEENWWWFYNGSDRLVGVPYFIADNKDFGIRKMEN